MAFWNEHAFGDHTSELLDGHFVSPVTNETCRLTHTERGLALALLRCWYANDENPWGDPMGYKISRQSLSKASGKRISDNLYRSVFAKLELAGVVSVIREPGEAHKVTLGLLLRCDQRGCRVELHYPGNYPLPKVSTPLPEKRGDLAFGEETPEVSRDIKNLNNSLITTNTSLGVSTGLEVAEGNSHLPSSNSAQTEPLVSRASEELNEWLESLPGNWVEWSYASARRKGFEKPTRSDLAYAEKIYKETGLDLEPKGAWQDGRANPRPALASNY